MNEASKELVMKMRENGIHLRNCDGFDETQLETYLFSLADEIIELREKVDELYAIAFPSNKIETVTSWAEKNSERE